MAIEPTSQVARTAQVFFERRELTRILQLYGRMVAAGEWRDYAIDGLPEACVFSVFRHTAQAKRQGAWAVIGEGGMVLKRAHELEQALTVFDSRKFRVVE
jgi:hypothetical protein